MVVEAITSAAAAAGVSAQLLLAICFVESSHRNVTVANDGGSPSIGICQVKLSTARMFSPHLTSRELRRPEVNAYYAARYLAHQLRRYGGDIERAIVAYNRGHAPLSYKKAAYLERVRKAQKEKPWKRKTK